MEGTASSYRFYLSALKMKIQKLFISHFFFRRSRSKGQAFVELVLVLPLFVIFLVGITYFARYFIVQIRLHQALRYAPWLRAYGYGAQVSNEEVQDEIERFLSESSPTLDAQNLVFNEVAGGRQGGALEGAFRATSVRVHLEYEMPVPRLLSSLPGFPSPWVVRANTELYP